MIYILFTYIHISKNTSCLDDVNDIYFFKKRYVSLMNVFSKFQDNFCFSK